MNDFIITLSFQLLSTHLKHPFHAQYGKYSPSSMYLYVSIFYLCDISNLSAGTTSHGTRSTWSRSTPAAVSMTSITWTSWATTPPPSLGGTSCWRQTASTTSTRRKKKRRISRRHRSQLVHGVFNPPSATAGYIWIRLRVDVCPCSVPYCERSALVRFCQQLIAE